jgi:hypothetical protein
MTVQNIIAALIVIAALAYVGSMLLRKARAFKPKAGCADDCGCSAKTKTVH